MKKEHLVRTILLGEIMLPKLVDDNTSSLSHETLPLSLKNRGYFS